MAEMRHSFAISVMAEEGLDLSSLREFVAGEAVRGFSLLTREQVEMADDDPEAVAKREEWKEKKTAGEVSEEASMPHDIFGLLLRSILKRPPPDSPPDPPENDESSDILLRIPRGPRNFIFSFDIPASVEEARQFPPDCGIDAMILVKSTDTSQDTGGAGGEGWFRALEQLASEQRLDGHNPTADCAFEMVLYAESAEQLLQNIARCLINVVNARIGYMDWMEDVTVVEMKPGKVETDCYEKLLADIPHESLSVSLILNAMVQQVAFSSADEGGERVKEFRVNEKNLSLIAGLNDLMLSAPHGIRDEQQQDRREVLPWQDDRLARMQRSGKRPALDVLHAEQQVQLFLNIAKHFPPRREDIPDPLHFAQLPPHRSSEEARFRLLLLEFESMLGIREEEEKESRKLRKFRFVEELSKDMMQQQILSSMNQEIEPDVLLHHYAREDLLLIAFASSCPASRKSTRSWKASTACHLGFWQWMQARNRLQASHLRAIAMASRRGKREEGTGAEQEGQAAEEEEGASTTLPLPDKPRVIYELDATRSLLFDRQEIVHMMNGRHLVRVVRRGCSYIRTSVGAHCVKVERMEEEAISCLKVVYSDNCCVWIRRDGETMLVDVSFHDGLLISVVNDDKIVQSRPHTFPRTGELSWSKQQAQDEAADVIHSLEAHRSGFVVLKRCNGSAEIVMEDGVKGEFKDSEWRWTTTDGTAVKHKHKEEKFERLVNVQTGTTTDLDKGQQVCWMEDGSFVILSQAAPDSLVHHRNGVEIEKKNKRVRARCAGFASVTQDEKARTVECLDGTRVLVSEEAIEIVRNDATLLQLDKTSLKGKFRRLTRRSESEQERNCVSFDLSAGDLKQVDEFGEEYHVTLSDAVGGEGGENETQQDGNPTEVVMDVVRLFAMRRDGSGFELTHEVIAQQELLNAKMSEMLVTDEENPQEGFGSISTIIKPRTNSKKVPQNDSDMNISCMSLLDNELGNDDRVLWRQFQCRDEIDKADMDKWRSAMAPAFELVFQSDKGDETKRASVELESLFAVIEAHRNSTCQCDRIEKYILDKLALFSQHRGISSPLIPVLSAPPAVFPSSSFRGVMKPSDPNILRPNYFSSDEGNKFLDSLGPEGRKKIVKEKRPWRRESSEDEKFDEEDEEDQDNRFRVDQQQRQQPPSSADSFHVSHLPTSEMYSVPANMQQESGTFSENFSRRAKTNYHLKHLRPAHYDILNRPRKHPIPEMTRHDADAALNEHFAVNELPVKRRTHTSSVLQKAILDAARVSQDITLDDMMSETSLSRVFRLRPRRANFGQLEMGKVYRFKLVLSNIGVELARYRIRQTESRNVRVVYNPGAVAAGMSVVMEIEINAEEQGRVVDEIVVETEKEVFTIPISAIVISSKDFQEWIERGGQVPCNVAVVDQRKHVLRSKPQPLATLRKEATSTKTKMFSESLRDLQDPVSEPQMSKYTTDKDWVVDPTRSLAEIKNLNYDQRLQLLTMQDMKRKGKLVSEETTRIEETETKTEDTNAE